MDNFIGKTVCFFGDYNPQYARNRVLSQGFEANGIKVISCNHKLKSLMDYIKLAKIYFKIGQHADWLLIGYSDNRFALFLAKLISRKVIVWDAFYSIYDTMIFDRQFASPKSLKAIYYWLIDYLNCLSANKILLDTNEHIRYFENTFKIKNRKFIRVLIGADNKVFYK